MLKSTVGTLVLRSIRLTNPQLQQQLFKGDGLQLASRWMSQCSCPGLGGPPPDKMYIEYDPEDLEQFIQFADAIEDIFPGVIVEGNAEGDGRPKSFEVTLPDGNIVFSKLQNGRLPSVAEVADMFTASSAQAS